MFETCFQAQVDPIWAVTTNKWVTDGNRITDEPSFYYHLPLGCFQTQWLGDRVWVIMESISYKLHSPREIFMASCRTSFWFTSLWQRSRSSSLLRTRSLSLSLSLSALHLSLPPYMNSCFHLVSVASVKMLLCMVDFLFKYKFIYFNWMLITLQYYSGFCHTLT